MKYLVFIIALSYFKYQMRPGKIISFFLVLLYVAACFYINYVEDFPPELSRIEINKNLYIAAILGEDKDLTLLSDTPEDYNYEYINSILSSPVVADTTLRSIVFENNDYYLKATAKSNSEARILVKLKIDKKLADHLKSNLYSDCVMIANLSKVESLPFSQNISDFEGNILWSREDSDILLEGDLLKITLVGSAQHNPSVS